jgi:hypothetical protein
LGAALAYGIPTSLMPGLDSTQSVAVAPTIKMAMSVDLKNFDIMRGVVHTVKGLWFDYTILLEGGSSVAPSASSLRRLVQCLIGVIQ